MEVKGFSNYLIYPQGKLFNKKTNRFIKGSLNSEGYLTVDFYDNKKRINKKIHRLLAEHFIENSDNKPLVDHINRIRNDNRLNNLRWVNHTENNQNKCVNKNNKLNIQYICYIKSKNKYQFKKTIKGTAYRKYFETLEDAIIFKNNFL